MGHFLMVLRYVSAFDFAVGTLPLSVVVRLNKLLVMVLVVADGGLFEVYGKTVCVITKI